MSCKKHGYTNDTFCPACDLETIENQKMTPQTAAALRALEQTARTSAKERPRLCAREYRQRLLNIANELAAVLSDLDKETRTEGTQEGAETTNSQPISNSLTVGEPRAALEPCPICKTPNKVRPIEETADDTPDEPRAAEGAGTVRMMKDMNGDIHEECPDCRGKCTPVECDTKPTAAAAVPAGGDAVAWRYWVSDTNHSVWHDMPVDQENRADCEELGYQVQYAYTVPAPRGGVTEAMVETAAKAIYDHWEFRSPVSTPAWVDRGNSLAQQRARWFARAALEATPPAAQAQDAGPMAKHWRASFMLWAINHAISGHITYDREFDDIEREARALAAKEPK